jgi:hypothetical protein
MPVSSSWLASAASRAAWSSTCLTSPTIRSTTSRNSSIEAAPLASPSTRPRASRVWETSRTGAISS